MDKDAVGPAIDAAAGEGIPVVGYDRLIEDDRAFYLTFDNKGVGAIIAQTVMAAQPTGNYAIIKGDKGDPNALFLLEGMMEVIGDAVAAGDITIVGESFTDGWKPDNAQKNMEQILTANNNRLMLFWQKTTAWRAARLQHLQHRVWTCQWAVRTVTKPR